MSNKDKRESPLVAAVLALDDYLSELERLGTKINSTDMSADVDLDYIQKLMARFAECGQGISEEVTKLSTELHQAQSRAEVVAQGVSRQAELFNVRRNEQNEKFEQFGILGDKVRKLNAEIAQFRPSGRTEMTLEDRARLTSNIPVFDTQLNVLIEELQSLRTSARESRMRSLEKSAESLGQTLQAVRKKLRELAGSED